MRFDPADLANPDSVIVKEALGRYCVICQARPKQPCANRIRPGQPLPGRCVHIARATNAKDTDKEEE